MFQTKVKELIRTHLLSRDLAHLTCSYLLFSPCGMQFHPIVSCKVCGSPSCILCKEDVLLIQQLTLPVPIHVANWSTLSHDSLQVMLELCTDVTAPETASRFANGGWCLNLFYGHLFVCRSCFDHYKINKLEFTSQKSARECLQEENTSYYWVQQILAEITYSD
jgi:hypothetical protein